jgi:hypothetical protein
MSNRIGANATPVRIRRRLGLVAALAWGAHGRAAIGLVGAALASWSLRERGRSG